MKILSKFAGRVISFNSAGPSRVQLTDLSNNNSCQTDANSFELQKVGIDHDGCEFEVLVVEENGQTKGVMKKIDPTAPVVLSPTEPPPSSFDI